MFCLPAKNKFMEILYYFLDLPTNMFQWQKYHIVDELAMHDIHVDIFSPLKYRNIDEANEMLLKTVKSKKYSMFMTCFNETYLYLETLREIKRYGIPTLLFCPDNLTAPFKHKKISPFFDLVWLTSVETRCLFTRWGAKTIFLPYAANPNFLKPVSTAHEVLRIGFIGTPHGSRIDRINKLIEEGIPVTVHAAMTNFDNKLVKVAGSNYLKKVASWIRYPIGWKLLLAAICDKLGHRKIMDRNDCLEIKNPVPLNKLANVNGSYALVLSFTDADSTGILKHPVPIVNLRNFEIPMSGAIQFTTYVEELASYFEEDKEIILCHNKDEYVEKAKYYLKDGLESIRNAIRINARKRAVAEHTWYHRFTSIFNCLGNAKGLLI